MFSLSKTKFASYKELKYLAYHDSLTGLLNRTWLYHNIDNINLKYVFFIDINNLKHVNKEGHTAGDEYIKMIVNIIRKLLVDKDIFIRYAGDEFIVFSNLKTSLTSTKLYAVGFSNLSYDVIKSIMKADKDMIASKIKIKQTL